MTIVQSLHRGSLDKTFGAPRRDSHGHHHCNMCSYAHALNLLWYPIIEYIESICRGEALQWTKSLGLNHAAILSEMIGIVGCIGATLEMDMFMYLIQKTLYSFLELHVPSKLVKRVVEVLVHLNLESTSSNALHLVRSSLCANLVGPALATQMD